MTPWRLPPGWRWVDVSGRLLWGGVLVLVLGAVLWLLDTSRTPVRSGPAPDGQQPDYRLQQFSWDHYGEQGQPQWRLAGTSLVHYPDGRSQILQARWTQRQDGPVQAPGASPSVGLLTVTAGEVQASGDSPRKMTLGQGAELLWQDAAGQTRLQVRTGAMLWQEASQRITSPAPVQVRMQGQDWTAGGFEYDIRQRMLRLKGPVRAVLQPG